MPFYLYISFECRPFGNDYRKTHFLQKRAHEVMRFRQKRNLLQKAMSDLPTIENTRAQNRTVSCIWIVAIISVYNVWLDCCV